MNKILFSIIFMFCSCTVMAFEILKFNGKVEYSFDNKNWKNLLVKQKFKSGVWIKTGPKAKVTLLLPNRTQTILSRNTTVQLNDNKKKESTGIKLNMGKIWAKTNKKPVKIGLKAPNAVASIRGTEWIYEVDSNQVSSMAVVEGQIELASNNGTKKSVSSGELASVSKNGVISVNKLLNPGDYLQFVFRYELEPYAYLPTEMFNSKQDRNKFIKELRNSNIKKNNPCNLNQVKELNYLKANIAKISYECLLKIEFSYTKSRELSNWLGFLQVEYLYSQGNIEEADQLLKKLPKNTNNKYVSAKYLFSKGSYEEATDILKSIIQSSTSPSSVNNLLATIEKAKGNKSKALFYYEMALEIDKNWPQPYIEMAKIYLDLSKFDKSISLLEEAKKVGLNKIDETSFLSQYLSYRYQIEKSKRLGQKVLDKNPLDLEMLIAQGITELKSGNNEKALDYFTKATAIERNYARTYVFMAVAHLHSGEFDQAVIQLERAMELDKLDPLPHVIVSQLFASKLNAMEAIKHAKLATKKTKPEDTFTQLANDQQGGINVGTRFLEVGLPNHAKESALKTKKITWAGSALFNAATAKSDLEKNSNFMRGFSLDSQTFGSRRDEPDIISKPGSYGYKELWVGLGNQNSDLGYKFGENGREIKGNVEHSHIYDIGVFALERDAYYAPDDTDRLTFALGFLGFGKRTNYDENEFITANIIPFQSDSTFDTTDTTLRVDRGKSFRTDKSTFLYTMAAEGGSADIGINVAGNCRGEDSMNTKALEYGVGELGRSEKFGQMSWSLDSAIRKGDTKYKVNGSSSTCSDLTSLIGGNYTNRDETLDSLEYEVLSNVQLVQVKNENTKYFLNLKAGYYHHEFDQDIIVDGTSQKDYRSDKHKFFVKPSLGTEMINGNKTMRISAKQDYHPLRQAPILIDDIAGLTSHYEFVNTGGKIDQLSFQWQQKNNDGMITFDSEFFEIENNPINLIFREQWNADLLSNFTLNKFYNPNKDALFSYNGKFARAEFSRLAFSSENFLSKKSTLKFGTEFWKADEKDHGKYDEPESLGKVPGVPKRIFYIGFTHMNEKYTLATRFVRNEDFYNKTSKLFESKNRINSNVTMPIWGGDLVFDISGEIDDASALKSIMLFRRYH